MYELTIHLQTKSKTPLYEQIYRYIKSDIQEGRIASGEKLPSTRALCRHLEVSRSTVEMAYEQLLSEGYIEAKACRGYYAARLDGLYQLTDTKDVKKEVRQSGEKKYAYDFTPNGVDLKSFPHNIWRRLSRECLLDDRAELFRLGSPRGEYGLRNAICNYLHHARGVNCTPEQIIVGAGSDYLLMLLAGVMGEGHTAALENPTYRQAYLLFRNLSYKVRTVELDAKGMRVDELEKSGADIAFVMPSHQYPLGVVMPLGRRMELLKWANEKDGRYIIEDDYDSEFRYKGKPIPALQGYDARGKVVYVGTFSKSIAPSIRISYMVLPEQLLCRYEEKWGFMSPTVSKVDQLILQKFIEEGYFERHLNKTRALYKNRHDVLLSCLKDIAADFSVSGENAGVHLLLRFHGSRTEDELISAAAEKSVKVYGLSDYYVENRREQIRGSAVILLGYANMSEENIRKASALLAEAWTQ